MQVQVKSWGNSHGIRLSKEIMESAGFHLNDVLQVTVSENEIKIQKSFVHKTLQQRMEAYNGQLNLSEEINWGEPVGREIW